MSEQQRFLVFGAHPDDADLVCGGAAIKWVKAGHQVKFVSVTNGEAGHQSMKPAPLAARRYLETQQSAALAGLAEYQVLSNQDGRLENTVDNREELIRIIRRFRPDAVITHRTCDYHADHRNAAQMVMDSSYLVQVPNCCADTPALDYNPVYAYCHDRFLDPRPFRPDASVEIDSVLELKFKLLDCHASQFYEWLAWVAGRKDFDASGMSWADKRNWLDRNWGIRWINAAGQARDVLVQTYGETGKQVRYAESFELSPYGRQPELAEFRRLFAGV